MKKIFTLLIGLSLWTLTATAQEPVAETTSPVATETDSLQRVVNDPSQQLRHQKNEELDRKNMEKQVQVLQPRLRKTIARIQGFRRREAEKRFRRIDQLG